MTKKAIIIGAGVAGPIMALQLQKIGYDSEIYESRSAENIHEGAFLGITPNGLNVLKEFINTDSLKSDFTPGSIRFYNHSGNQIAELLTAYQKDLYGCETLQIKRSNFNIAVREAAVNKGIRIHYSKKFKKLTETGDKVTATFEDNSKAEGDLLIACDGMFSSVRSFLFPDTSFLHYTKLISTGGFAHVPGLSTPSTAIRMCFGERGFFAYSVSDRGEVWWFNNYYREVEPGRSETELSLKEEIKHKLLEIHKNDDPLFSEIIKHTDDIIAYPVYDLPKLPNWYKGRVCLIGDAAHGISPHVGQGASLALEDTLVLSHYLEKEKNFSAAFQNFQDERKPRVEKVIKTAQKVGNTKSKTNPIAAWFRDRLIGFFIKQQIKQLDWLYGWKLGK